MASRVTIQDIADAVGVSRNTVSKAINNTGILADSTREKILLKAKEMGYKQFSYVNISSMAASAETSQTSHSGEIALFTTSFLGASHFASLMLDKFQQELSLAGYSLSMHRVLPDELTQCRLPSSFDPERTDGILCVEMFDYDYSRMLCDQEIPILFADTPVLKFKEPLRADLLYMDNQTEIYRFVQKMASIGKTDIGFIGEISHCQSFFERYLACKNAIDFLHLPFNSSYYLTDNNPDCPGSYGNSYENYLDHALRNLPVLPDVFICANDFIAINILHVFEKLGIRVPDDVLLCGFDDSPESRILTPRLTSIHIHTQIMGLSAAHLLLSRIKEPALNYRTVYTETNIIYRESTKVDFSPTKEEE